ncbi:hypothetical protein J6590_087272 [Homalodisca vitripennis]|nr:hypothetical protein J6590_087272 [Homalodisca vitripennis]
MPCTETRRILVREWWGYTLYTEPRNLRVRTNTFKARTSMRRDDQQGTLDLRSWTSKRKRVTDTVDTTQAQKSLIDFFRYDKALDQYLELLGVVNVSRTGNCACQPAPLFTASLICELLIHPNSLSIILSQ